MANEVMQSLFGLDSASAAEALRQRQAAEDLAYAQMSPKQQVVYNMAQAGRQAGAGLNQLFGYVPPELQRVRSQEEALMEVQQSGIDLNDPEAVYPALAKALASRGLQQEAMTITMQGQSAIAEQLKTQSEILRNRAAAAKSLAEKKPLIGQLYAAQQAALAEGDAAQAAVYGAAIDKANHQTPEQVRSAGERALAKPESERTPEDKVAIAAYDVWYKTEIALSKAKSTTINVGDKQADISGMSNNIRAVLGPIKEKIQAVETAQTQLDLALKGNASASAQMERFLATLAGDKQLGVQEVERVANAGSLDVRIANKITGFFAGGKSEPTYDEWQALIDAMGNYHGSVYNKERTRLSGVWTNAPGITQGRIDAALGEPWEPRDKRAPTPQPAAAAQGGVSIGKDFGGKPVMMDKQGRYYIENKDGTKQYLKKKGK